MCALGLLAVFCVLSIFFFPAQQGPYPAIHGPVTALRAMVLALRLFCVLALLVLHPWLGRLLSLAMQGRQFRKAESLARPDVPARGAPVLPAVIRC